MRPAGYAPLYVGLYPELAEIARRHGYALAVHGSMNRDFDLICVPWVEYPSEPEVVIDEITTTFAIRRTRVHAELKEHGRMSYVLSLSFGECFIDLSFMPRLFGAQSGQ